VHAAYRVAATALAVGAVAAWLFLRPRRTGPPAADLAAGAPLQRPVSRA
jgi:hypothetical protein